VVKRYPLTDEITICGAMHHPELQHALLVVNEQNGGGRCSEDRGSCSYDRAQQVIGGSGKSGPPRCLERLDQPLDLLGQGAFLTKVRICHGWVASWLEMEINR
jgi:hypothetical protein